LVFCSYLGGTNDDKGYGLALTRATTFMLPVKPRSTDFPLLNPAQAAKGGNFDAFSAKISSSRSEGLTLPISGAAAMTRLLAIAVNSAGNAYVTGLTASTNFPIANPLQLNQWRRHRHVCAKLNSPQPSALFNLSCGSANEDFHQYHNFQRNIVVDFERECVTSPAYSFEQFSQRRTPFSTANAGGASDAFVAKISDTTPAADFAVSASPASQNS